MAHTKSHSATTDKGRAAAKTAMGTKRTVEISACLWMDLLGYGDMLRKVRFDLTTDGAHTAISRLFQFQEIVAKHSEKLFTTVLLNDGCVAFRDLSPRTKSVTHDFLNRAYRLHEEINESEKMSGFPGVRSVLAVGFRHRRASENFTKMINGYGKFLIEKVETKEITAKEAIIKALVVKPPFDQLPDLQANFAFTKAYLADHVGTKGGFGGPNFFVDQNMLPEPTPDWMTYDVTPELKEDGIGGIFLRVTSMKRFALNEENKDLLDAFEIAERLTGSADIASKLRRMTLHLDKRARRPPSGK